MRNISWFEENKVIINNYPKIFDDFAQEYALVIEMTLSQPDEIISVTSSRDIDVNLFFFSTMYKYVNLVEYFEKISIAICEKCFNGDYSQMREDILNSEVNVDLNEVFEVRNSFLGKSSKEELNTNFCLSYINKQSHKMNKVIEWYREKFSL